MDRTTFVVSLWAALILCSCTKVTSVHLIDNPTNRDITITIDGVTSVIPALSYSKQLFEAGIHQLIYNGDSVYFVVLPTEKSGLINPTLSTYYIGVTLIDSKDLLEEQPIGDNKIPRNLLSTQNRPLPITNKDSVLLLSELFIDPSLFDVFIDHNAFEAEKEISALARLDSTVSIKKLGRFLDIDYQIHDRALLSEKTRHQKKCSEPLVVRDYDKNYGNINGMVMPQCDVSLFICDSAKIHVTKLLSTYKKWIQMKGEDFTTTYYNALLKNKIAEMGNLCHNTYAIDPSLQYFREKVKEGLPDSRYTIFKIDKRFF